MSVVRIASGVLAGFVKSTGCAVGTTRKAPPVPLALSWQPEPAQVLVESTPFWLITSGVRKIGLMQRWKYANDSFWPDTPGGLLTSGGLSSGLELPPPQLARTSAAARRP